MLLSDALLLGSVIESPIRNNWYKEVGFKIYGCALTMALIADGVDVKNLVDRWIENLSCGETHGGETHNFHQLSVAMGFRTVIEKRWPWIKHRRGLLATITSNFDMGLWSVEDIIVAVKQYEPKQLPAQYEPKQLPAPREITVVS